MEMRLGDFTPVDSQFFIGAAVKDAAYPFDCSGNIFGAESFFRAAETQMLDKMGHTGLSFRLITGTGSHVNAN